MKKITIALTLALLPTILLFWFPPRPCPAASNSSVNVRLKKNSLEWPDWKDASNGDNQTTGIPGVQLYGYDGTNYDRLKGDQTSGLWVNQKTSVQNGGTAFYAIKYTSLAAVSTTFAFGFTSRVVIVETPATNTDDVIVDWLGGAAVAPAADTAGDDIIPPGRVVVFDDYRGISISAIAASGTQTIHVRAFY